MSLDAAITSAYAQLLSVGVLWIALHCAGMCGPLVLGLDVGGCMSRRAAARRTVWRHMLAYQLGKGAIYAVLGAVAGAAGHSLAAVLKQDAPWVAGLLGLALIGGPLLARRRRNPLATLGAQPALSQRVLSRIALAVHRLGAPDSMRRSLLLGALMSVVPCMIVVWVLTLAASTQSPLHGALLMLVLVAMNSLPLLGVTLLPTVLSRRGRMLARLTGWLMPLSGAWLLLVALAAGGLVPHASVGFELGGRGYVVMFW